MFRLQGCVRPYAWGRVDTIPHFFGLPPAEVPVAEVWFGAHPAASARLISGPAPTFFDPNQMYPSRALTDNAAAGSSAQISAQTPAPSTSLGDYIAAHPREALGNTVNAEHGPHLPYLLKIIAPAEPLSLQVHPNLEQAREGFEREEREGIPRDSPRRSYRDFNHKPEMAYAITPFQALVGFRTARRIAEILDGLDAPFARRLRDILPSVGVAGIFRYLLSAESRPDRREIAEVVDACRRRAESGDSPSPRADRTAVSIAERYPDDPGVIASLLLNPVSLRPGEALFIPAGMVHAYLSGLAVEIMASSDNVLRAGLTVKHIDIPELLRILDDSAAPPIRIAPERVSEVVSTFYAPVDDFELSIVQLTDATKLERLRFKGPRTLVCLEGGVQLFAAAQSWDFTAGQAVFVPDSDGPVSVRGFGQIVVATVP